MRRPTRISLVLAPLTCLALTPALLAQGDDFGSYWYQGQAEITSYTLEQARYGEVHPGQAVLVFVTEDFSASKHVKLDNPRSAGDDRVPVLKLNLTKKFDTGVYPYSMMTSVFTPVGAGAGQPLKITTSSQEWCGHTFTQLDRIDRGYRVREHSYFESEGDRDLELDVARTEDGLWTLLRIDPERLPTGSFTLIPGSMFQRLRHQPWVPRRVEANLSPHPSNPALRVYTLTYPELGRTLAIHFEAAFPHTIEGWEESYRSGWGSGARVLTTRATQTARKMLDYWNRHDLDDAPLRSELGLD